MDIALIIGGILALLVWMGVCIWHIIMYLTHRDRS